MNTHADRTQENKSQSVANAVAQKQNSGEYTYQFVGNRPEAIQMRKLQEMANNGPGISLLKACQEMANNSPQEKQAAQLQAMADNYSACQQQPIQKKENNTGLPDNLKSSIEHHSGYSMDDVKVHYNSDKPAQLQAHAYAQGTDIHLASGQERNLPHEAWHVVQQKQGRVKPTMQMKGGVNVNDDAGLEKEADVMGAKAMDISNNNQSNVSKDINNSIGDTVQRAVGFEFQTGWQAYMEIPAVGDDAPTQITFPKETALYGGRNGASGWAMETDGRDIEFVIEPPIEESDAGVIRLNEVMSSLRNFTDFMQGLDSVDKLNPNILPALFNEEVGNTTVIEPRGLIRAQPQATVGVQLDRIEALFREIGRQQEASDLSSSQGTSYFADRAIDSANMASGIPNVNNNAPSHELKGIVTMLVQYLCQGQQQGRRAYAKDIAYAMARTDFVKMFSMIPEADYFKQNVNIWVQYVLTAAGLANTEDSLLINQKITDGQDAYGMTVDEENALPKLPLKRGEWLSGIAYQAAPVDRLTQAATNGQPAYTDVKGGNRLRAMGLLGDKTDPVGAGNLNEGIIIELRQMKKNIPATQWKNVCQSLLNYLIALNNWDRNAGDAPEYNRL